MAEDTHNSPQPQLLAPDVIDSGAPESRACNRVLNTVELTSNVFKFLKEATYEEYGIVSAKDGVPAFPPSWTQYFARLALVNRTFFHESIGVLWEQMNSAAPFFELLLPADRDGDGKLYEPLGYAVNTITAEHWRRYAEYASRTRVLALHRPKLGDMNPAWLMHLAMSKLRPDPLFPALRHLILTSTDGLSIMIAISSAPYAKLVTINLDSKYDEKDDEVAAAVTASICGVAGRLTELRVHHPTIDNSHFFLPNISRTPSVTSLEVTIPCLSQHSDFPSLAKCRSLKKLVMAQALPHNDSSASATDRWPTSLKLQEHVSQAPRLPHLESLRVSSNALTHLLLAQELPLQSLTSLELEIKLDAFDDQLVLIPHALTIHSTRNTSLKSLEIVCRGARSIPSEAVAPRRGDWRYINFTQLWTGLKGLRSLTTLKIVDVPFLCADILDRLLDVLRALPQMEIAVLCPRRLTDLEADELTLPSMRRLEDVSRHNPNLVRLEVAMDFEAIPEMPKKYISNHRLQTLRLLSNPEEVLSLNEFSNDELLSLGRYIDRLFPTLERLTDGWKEGSNPWKMWDYMESVVLSFQDLRAQAAADLQAFGSSS